MFYILPKKVTSLKKSTNKHTYFRVVDLYDEDKNFIERRIYKTKETFNKILDYCKKRKLSILYRGIFVLKREQIQQAGLNPKNSIKLDSSKKVLEYVLIDIDKKDEETFSKIKGFVMYMKRLGIDLFVYETKNGYHIYIVFQDANFCLKTRKRIYFCNSEEENKIVSAIKYILDKKIKLKYDIVSSKQAIWYERIYNYYKNYKTKLIFSGNYIEAKKASQFINRYSKLGNKKIVNKSINFTKSKNKFIGYDVQFNTEERSTDIQMLQANYKAGFYYARQNVSHEIAYQIFCNNLGKKISNNLFYSFYSFCLEHKDDIQYKNKNKNKKEKNEQKNKHFTDYVYPIYNYLKDKDLNKISQRQICKELDIPRSSLYHILKITNLDTIKNNPKYAISLLIHGNKNKIRSSKEINSKEINLAKGGPTPFKICGGGIGNLYLANTSNLNVHNSNTNVTSNYNNYNNGGSRSYSRSYSFMRNKSLKSLFLKHYSNLISIYKYYKTKHNSMHYNETIHKTKIKLKIKSFLNRFHYHNKYYLYSRYDIKHQYKIEISFLNFFISNFSKEKYFTSLFKEEVILFYSKLNKFDVSIPVFKNSFIIELKYNNEGYVYRKDSNLRRSMYSKMVEKVDKFILSIT